MKMLHRSWSYKTQAWSTGIARAVNNVNVSYWRWSVLGSRGLTWSVGLYTSRSMDFK